MSPDVVEQGRQRDPSRPPGRGRRATAVLLALALVGGLGFLLQRTLDTQPSPPRSTPTAAPTATPATSPTAGTTAAPGSPGTLGSLEATAPALAPYPTAENRRLDACRPNATALASCGPAPRLRSGTWFGTPGGRPVRLSGLRGRVVLVHFFSTTCISCRRALPEVEEWARRYRPAGLRVIGVLAPEFGFEQRPAVARAALRGLDLPFPVLLDADRETYDAYRDRALPSSYLLDARGTVRSIGFGEGGAVRTETAIRALLRTATPAAALPPRVAEADAPGPTPGRTPTLYTRPHQAGYVGFPPYLSDAPRPVRYGWSALQASDTYGLTGRWRAADDALVAAADGAELRLRYYARSAYAVLGGTGRVQVTRDGVTVTLRVGGPPRLRTLLGNDGPASGQVVLTLDAGVRVYALSFG